MFLIKDANIPFGMLIALEPAIRDQLIANSYKITRLIIDANIPFKELIGQGSEILNQLIANSNRIIDLMGDAQQTHQYLIRNNIITRVQLAISLLDETPYPTIQHFVNEKLSASGVLPEGYQLQAENITDLIHLVKGVAEIRKNVRFLSNLKRPISSSNHPNSMFFHMPDDVKKTIAGFTGNDRGDEIRIADRNYGKPPERPVPKHNFEIEFF
jgi:hypothetical protein